MSRKKRLQKKAEKGKKSEAKQQAMAAKAAAKPKKKRVKLNVVEGRVYIKSTFNNTLITITDTEGRVIATGSAGQQGFRGSKKSTSFAASKAASDCLVRSYFKTYGLPATMTNTSNNYGPYQYPEKLIPLSITSMLQDRQVPVHGSGEHVRSWLHVHDFCRAIDTVARTAADYSIYNVSGEEKTNMEVLTALATYLKKDINTVKKHVSDRPGPDMRYSPDSTRLTQELGWQRLRPFNEALGEVVHWYQTNEQWWRDIQRKPWFIEQFERQSSGRWV